MDFSARATCSHARRDGTPCRAAALPGKDCCTFHDPDLAARRAAGRRQGGETRSRRAAVLADLPDDTPLASVGDVTAFLATVARKTIRGELDARVANSVTQTCSVLLRALEPGEIEELKDRVQRVEGKADVFTRVAEFSEALRQLRDADAGRNNGAGHGDPADNGSGERGVPAGAVRRLNLGELLAVPAADGAAG
jgi:hypothetical protein